MGGKGRGQELLHPFLKAQAVRLPLNPYHTLSELFSPLRASESILAQSEQGRHSASNFSVAQRENVTAAQPCGSLAGPRSPFF